MHKITVSFSVRPNQIIYTLSIIIGGVIFLGLISACIVTFTNYKTAMGFNPLFNMDNENSIPTYFSSFNLTISSFLLFLIYLHKKRTSDKFQKHWLILAVIFLFLSIDETASIHEYLATLLNELLGTPGPTRYIFALIGFIAILILLFYYSRFLFSLPQETRIKVITSGIVFISGALIAEAIGGYIIENSLGYYAFSVVLEESLEMLGVLLFVKALLKYIVEYLVGDENSIFFSKNKKQSEYK